MEKTLFLEMTASEKVEEVSGKDVETLWRKLRYTHTLCSSITSDVKRDFDSVLIPVDYSKFPLETERDTMSRVIEVNDTENGVRALYDFSAKGGQLRGVTIHSLEGKTPPFYFDLATIPVEMRRGDNERELVFVYSTPLLLYFAILLNSEGVDRKTMERVVDLLPLSDEFKKAIRWIADNAGKELKEKGLPLDPFTSQFGVPLYEWLDRNTPFYEVYPASMEIRFAMRFRTPGATLSLTYPILINGIRCELDFKHFINMTKDEAPKLEKKPRERDLLRDATDVVLLSITPVQRKDTQPLRLLYIFDKTRKLSVHHRYVSTGFHASSRGASVGQRLPAKKYATLLDHILQRMNNFSYILDVYIKYTYKALENTSEELIPSPLNLV